MVCSGTGVPPFQGPEQRTENGHANRRVATGSWGLRGGQGPQTGAPGCADRSGVWVQ